MVDPIVRDRIDHAIVFPFILLIAYIFILSNQQYHD